MSADSFKARVLALPIRGRIVEMVERREAAVIAAEADTLRDAAEGLRAALEKSPSVALTDEGLALLRRALKSGEYSGVDIMRAWIAVDELRAIRAALATFTQATGTRT